jgi:hypothetical protein
VKWRPHPSTRGGVRGAGSVIGGRRSRVKGCCKRYRFLLMNGRIKRAASTNRTEETHQNLYIKCLWCPKFNCTVLQYLFPQEATINKLISGPQSRSWRAKTYMILGQRAMKLEGLPQKRKNQGYTFPIFLSCRSEIHKGIGRLFMCFPTVYNSFVWTTLLLIDRLSSIYHKVCFRRLPFTYVETVN